MSFQILLLVCVAHLFLYLSCPEEEESGHPEEFSRVLMMQDCPDLETENERGLPSKMEGITVDFTGVFIECSPPVTASSLIASGC